MSRTHAEIGHQVSQLHRLLAGLGNETVQPEDVIELRRLLYGLYAVLRLHNAQEEEDAFSLVPNGTAIGQAATGLQPPAAPGAGPRSDVSPGTGPAPVVSSAGCRRRGSG